MYTGIVDHLGEIIIVSCKAEGIHLTISCDFDDLINGESIAVDGCCITAINPVQGQFECDISPETLQLTTAGTFKAGQKVNLERSLRLDSRLGGHFVMGHVDTTASISERRAAGECVKFTVSGFSLEHMVFFAKKGSVSVNGVSLTINEVFSHAFDLMIIPHTLARTTWQFIGAGDTVNIEFDTLARIVVQQLNNQHNLQLTMNHSEALPGHEVNQPAVYE